MFNTSKPTTTTVLSIAPNQKMFLLNIKFGNA